MKSIILAGGTATRLYPACAVVPKHLVTVYDKPAIYYALTQALDFGVDDLMVVTRVETRAATARLVSAVLDGTGVEVSYIVQEEPRGVAHALVRAREWLKGEACLLQLSDNVYGVSLAKAGYVPAGLACAWLAQVPDEAEVARCGVYDTRHNVIVEKPKVNIGTWVVTGTYYLPEDACARAAQLAPSARGELEITDLLNLYLSEGKLDLHFCMVPWYDVGTPDGLLGAAMHVAKALKAGQLVGSPELALARRGLRANPPAGTSDYACAVTSQLPRV